MNTKIFKFINVALILTLSLFNFGLTSVKAATLTGGSVLISDSRPSQAAVSYTIDVDNVSLSAIRCIKVAFSTSTSSQTKPTGMNIASATFSGDYVPTPASWTVTNTDATGVTQITYATGETPASATDRTIVLSGITNGSVVETGYFVMVNTYSNVDCATGPVDNGTVMYIYANGQLVTATVDPTLTFTITEMASGGTVNGATTNITTTDGTIPFGTVTASTNKIGGHTLALSTNATNGYTVTTRYTQKLLHSNAVDDINDHTGTNAAPSAFPAAGTEAFGYTTEDTTLGTGTPNRFATNLWAAFTTSPVEVMYGAGEGTETIDVGYQVGIAATTSAGFYQTTVIYVATPTY